MDRPTRICRCGYLCRLWAVGGERREYTARGNCGQVARREVPAVRLAGRCGGPGHAVALSLLVQLRDPGLRDFAMGPNGVEHELGLVLPAGPGPVTGPGRTVRLLFFRGHGPDFSERDRALLTLLRPHLLQAYRDAERCRAGTPQLTPRHWELLRLVAAGHTNAQIARRLGVSEGTVRKHLENIYTRLQVSSRTAAVTSAFPEG